MKRLSCVITAIVTGFLSGNLYGADDITGSKRVTNGTKCEALGLLLDAPSDTPNNSIQLTFSGPAALASPFRDACSKGADMARKVLSRLPTPARVGVQFTKHLSRVRGDHRAVVLAENEQAPNIAPVVMIHELSHMVLTDKLDSEVSHPLWKRYRELNRRADEIDAKLQDGTKSPVTETLKEELALVSREEEEVYVIVVAYEELFADLACAVAYNDPRIVRNTMIQQGQSENAANQRSFVSEGDESKMEGMFHGRYREVGRKIWSQYISQPKYSSHPEIAIEKIAAAVSKLVQHRLDSLAADQTRDHAEEQEATRGGLSALGKFYQERDQRKNQQLLDFVAREFAE